MTDTVNNSTTYLWYDYETFGTEARKDRPVQYGSFRTGKKSLDLRFFFG